MDQEAIPPPAPDCLTRPYPSTQKGGTLIAPGVLDLASHKERICNPDDYRPVHCRNCGHDVLHVHDYRWRTLLNEADTRGLKIVRYACARCNAIWRILPRFLARYLRRMWTVVEVGAQLRLKTASQSRIPERTARRWRARLKTSIRQLVSVLAASDEAALKELVGRLEAKCTRRQLVVVHQEGLSALAMLVHRLVAGVRVM